jgi:hypothetical protein
MQKNNHLPVARLEEGVLDVVVHDVDLVAADRRVSESVDVRLEGARKALLHNIRPDVEVLELGIALALRDHEDVLRHQIRLLLVVGLALLVALLDLLDQAEGVVEV